MLNYYPVPFKKLATDIPLKMNNFQITITPRDFPFSYTDRRYFVLAKDARTGVLALFPLPLSYQGLRVPGYELGIQMEDDGWEDRSFRQNWTLRNLFGSGVITTPDSMEVWLEKPRNQKHFKQAIREHYTIPGRRILSYNGENNWTLVPYQ
jgi:hypothetical protein